jgi:hypothetical protein
MRRVRLFALACLAAVAMPACEFDPFDFASVVDYDQSDDPEVRALPEILADATAEAAANDALSLFLGGGARTTADLEHAIDLQPDNPQFRAIALVNSGLDEELDDFGPAKRELLEAVAKKLKRDGENYRDVELVKSQARGEFERAKSLMRGALGHGLPVLPEI